jgi:uncharacterized membrane protein YfcA
VDVTLAVLLAVGAVIGAYAIGQPLVQSPHLDPRFYKKLFGLLLLVVGLDMVSGCTDTLRQRQEQGAAPVERAARVSSPDHSPSRFCQVVEAKTLSRRASAPPWS